MFKPNTLLKVVSIILIVLGALGTIINLFSFTMLSKMGSIEGIDQSLVDAALSPSSIVISIISGVALIAAGIIGVMGKSVKVAIICIAVYIIISIVSIIQNMGTIGFTFMSVVDFILPALYIWGIYQSK